MLCPDCHTEGRPDGFCNECGRDLTLEEKHQALSEEKNPRYRPIRTPTNRGRRVPKYPNTP